MAVCIETLIPNGERRNPVIGRDLFSTCIYFGSVSFFFFFFLNFTTAFFTWKRGEVFIWKKGKASPKPEKSSKMICIDPPHQHECVKRKRRLFYSPFSLHFIFPILCVALVFLFFLFISTERNIASHNMISETIGTGNVTNSTGHLKNNK